MNQIDVKILDGLAEGLNQREISKKLEIEYKVVLARLRKINRKREKIDGKDDRIFERLLEGLTPKEISEQLEITCEAIKSRINEIKELQWVIPKNIGRPKKTENDEIDKRILEEVEKGLRDREIAEKLNVTRDTVSDRIYVMRKRGIEIPRKAGKLKKIENDKIDNEILEGLAMGLNQTQIAKKLNYTRANISDRIKRMRKRGVEIPQSTGKIENDSKRNMLKENKENKIAKQIIKLMDTKNATEEQVRILANIYGVDIEGLLNYIETQER